MPPQPQQNKPTNHHKNHKYKLSTYKKKKKTANPLKSLNAHSLVSVPKPAKLLLPGSIPHVELDGPAVSVERQRAYFNTQCSCQKHDASQKTDHMEVTHGFIKNSGLHRVALAVVLLVRVWLRIFIFSSHVLPASFSFQHTSLCSTGTVFLLGFCHEALSRSKRVYSTSTQYACSFFIAQISSSQRLPLVFCFVFSHWGSLC